MVFVTVMEFLALRNDTALVAALYPNHLLKALQYYRAVYNASGWNLPYKARCC